MNRVFLKAQMCNITSMSHDLRFPVKSQAYKWICFATCMEQVGSLVSFFCCRFLYKYLLETY